jgi:hypothetical protein
MNDVATLHRGSKDTQLFTVGTREWQEKRLGAITSDALHCPTSASRAEKDSELLLSSLGSAHTHPPHLNQTRLIQPTFSQPAHSKQTIVVPLLQET